MKRIKSVLIAKEHEAIEVKCKADDKLNLSDNSHYPTQNYLHQGFTYAILRENDRML